MLVVCCRGKIRYTSATVLIRESLNANVFTVVDEFVMPKNMSSKHLTLPGSNRASSTAQHDVCVNGVCIKHKIIFHECKVN